MFDVGLQKLKCGTEAGRSLTFASPKSSILHYFILAVQPSAESCAVGGQRVEATAWIVQRFQLA